MLTSLRAFARSENQASLEKFRAGLEGTATTPDDENYELRRLSLVWNLIKPRRYPAMIVQAASVDDVIRTVKFARRSNYRISIRCGGHNYVSSYLVDGALVLDISHLHGIEIDPARRIAKVGPAIRSAPLIEQLAEHDLAFPTAHSGYVAMGGYLLGGGVGWNAEAWGGVACLNVEEVEIVTADGELVTANERENPDLFWAVRGAGPCFFGVVTSFTLKLYEQPKAVMSSSYVWSIADAEEACAWAYQKSTELPDFVEAWFVMAADNVCMMLARAFASDEASARAALAPLTRVDQEVSGTCLNKDEFTPTSIIDLTHETDAEAPPWRWGVDSMWTDEPPQTLAALVLEHMQELPSDKSSVLFVFKPHTEQLPDAALSMVGKTYFGNFNIWMDAADDRRNIEWRDETMTLVKPHIKGHYINEADFLAIPSRVENSFSPSNWKRLNTLRDKHDPGHLFHTQLG